MRRFLIFIIIFLNFQFLLAQNFEYSIDNKAKFRNIYKIGILPFDNLDEDIQTDWIGYAIEMFLTLDFTKVNKINLANSYDLYVARNSLLKPNSGITTEIACNIGVINKCDAIIFGEYSKKTEEIYNVKLKILNIKEKVLSEIEYELKLKEFFDKLDEIILDLCNRFNINITSQEIAQIKIKETDSISALRYLVNGLTDNSIKEDPNFATAYYFKAETLRGVDYRRGIKIDLPSAIDNYLTALKLRPNYLLVTAKLIETYLEFAASLKKEGKNKEAEEQYKMIEALLEIYEPEKTESISYYFALGKFKEQLKEFKSAIEYYQKAIKIFPNNFNIRFQLGNVYLIEGRYDDAILEFKRILTDDPDFSKAYLGLGEAYWKMNEKDKAIYYLEKASEYFEIEKDVISLCKRLNIPITFLPPYRVYWEGLYIPIYPSYLDKVNLNTAEPGEIYKKTGLPVDICVAIYEQRKKFGKYENIYQLRQINGMKSEYFDILKEKAIVYKPYEEIQEEEIAERMERLTRELISDEDRYQSAAFEEYVDAMRYNLNINKMTTSELMMFPNVSLIDAAAIRCYIKNNGAIQYNDWRNIPYLSSYGWRNIRNFVKFSDKNDLKFQGEYQLVWKEQTSLANYTGGKLYKNYEWQDNLSEYVNNISHKLKLKFYNLPLTTKFNIDLKYGLLFSKDLESGNQNNWYIAPNPFSKEKEFFTTDTGVFNNNKWFLSIHKIPFVQKIIIGNYTVCFNQGLVLNNNDDNGYDRLLNYTEGIYQDLMKDTRFFTFNGLAVNGNIYEYLDYTGFYSKANRDVITNSDGTANYYILPFPQNELWKNKLTEEMVGGALRLNISPGTYIGSSFYQIQSSRKFTNNVMTVAADNSYFPVDEPTYLSLHNGNFRSVLGINAGLTYKNYSLESEYAKLLKDKLKFFGNDYFEPERYAFIATFRAIFNKFNLRILYRDYSIDFDNPYARTFAEAKRFSDTVFEDKTYRLKDERYYYVSQIGMPKPERGVYAEISYLTLNENWRITRLYYDWWIRKQDLIFSSKVGNSYKNIYADTYNDRFEGEIEYRVVFPLRFRLKQKVSRKNINHDRSLTTDTRLRIMALLTDYDFFETSYIIGSVYVRGGNPQNRSYSYDTLMRGNAITGYFEHKFSKTLQLGIWTGMWRADGNTAPGGYSVWYFDPNGISFMEGDKGMHIYTELINQVYKNLFYKMIFSYKKLYFIHSDQENYNGYWFGRNSEESSIPVNNDFTSIYRYFEIQFQLNIIF